MRQPAGRPTLSQTIPPESDITVALFRSAFIVAFSIVASLSGLYRTNPFTWMAAALAMVYTVSLFLVWLRRQRPLPAQRPLALCVDIILVTVVAGTCDFLALPVENIYYLVIFAAGMWYRTVGAVAVGAVSMAAYCLAYNVGMGLRPEISSLARTAYETGAFAMPFVGYAVGVMFRSQARDLLRLADMDHEIGLARSLQDRLVPETPRDIPGWEVSACMTRAGQVGGDFYDFLALRDGSHLICLADMAGKSVYGLVHLSLLHSQIHDVADQTDDLGALASEVARRAWPELRPDSYAAAVFLRIAGDDDSLVFVNCGHLPPLLVARDGSMQELFSGDPIIGARPRHQYRPAAVEARSGAMVVCYTDGLVEARGERGQQFGEERLRAAVKRLATQAPAAEHLCTGLLSEVATFSRGEAGDDRTVIVLRRLPAAGTD